MDRQDIDALLVGALYGELTPADEARLAAHLESHPTDRGALDDLKSARAAVRESRIFELQLDPPQAVSALLLQEAHRRAPKRAAQTSEEKESWFYRFTRVFMAHPAMAAAAMLVLVVGVFGTLYVKKGADSQFAEKTAVAPSSQLEAAQDIAQNDVVGAPLAELTTGAVGSAAATAAPEAADQGAAEGKAGYAVQLDETARGRADALADRDRSEQAAKMKRQATESTRKSSGMVVSTPQPQPKELPAPRSKAAAPKGSVAKGDFAGNDDASDGFASAPGAEPVVGGASGAGGAPAQRTPPRNAPAQSAPASPSPPPPAVATAPSTSSATVAKPAAKPSATKEAEKPADAKADAAPAKDNSLLAWAKSEHSRTVALANKGDCNAAAKAAVQVLNRAPDYYSQFMATDRLLKKCQAYIAQERDAEAERSGKARSKRVTTDEPAATTK